MPKLPKKKTEKLAYHKALGETLGKLQAEFRFKQTKKGWMKSLRDHIGRMIDGINAIELAVVLSGAWLIYKSWIKTAVAEILGLKEEDLKNEVALFGLSFFVSYILVKHFGQIVMGIAEVGKGLMDLLRAIIIAGSFGATAGAMNLTPAIQFFTQSMPLVTLVPQGIPQPFGFKGSQFGVALP
jgi:hypothetical protein